MAINERVFEIFKFIDFLHLNINEFNKYNNVIEECVLLREKRNCIDPNINYKFKLEYDETNKLLIEKNDIFVTYRVKPIINIAEELRIIDNGDSGGMSIDNNCQSALLDLKDNFEINDIEVINEYKEKYIEFRNEVDNKICLNFFFDHLDRCLSLFFNYFNEDITENKFAQFETIYEKVNSIEEMLNNIKDNKSCNITIPYENLFNSSNSCSNVSSKSNQQEIGKIWFFIGVKLATGEIRRLYDSFQNQREVARQLGNESSYRPYISSSLGYSEKKDPKNIYTRADGDLLLIESYCIEKGLEIIDPKFIEKLEYIKRG